MTVRLFAWLLGIGPLIGLSAQTVSFQSSTVPLPCVSATQSLVSGDFNGDHKADLAVLCSDQIVVLLGNGDGTFQAPVTLMPNLGGQYLSLQGADFNHNGQTGLTLAVYNSSTEEESLYLFVWDGSGFGPPQNASSASQVDFSHAAFVDLKGDGILDLVTELAVPPPNITGSTVLLGPYDLAVLPGQSGLMFGTPTQYPAVAGDQDGILTGVFNAGGNADVVVTNPNGVFYVPGNGDGTLLAPVTLTSDSGISVLGDFNGDGKPGVALISGTENIEVFLGNGDGTFQPEIVAAKQIANGLPGVGDFNNDGVDDIAIVDNRSGMVNIFLSNQEANMRFVTGLQIGAFGSSPAIADFNGDGRPDIAVATYGPQVLYVFLNTTPLPPQVTVVQNAAATTQPPVSGGALISIFGTGFGSATPSGAGTIPLPETLGGVSVTLNGTAVPLLYVSSTQINGQAPWNVAPGTGALVVMANNQPSASFNVTAGPFSPAIFATGNQAVAINPDNTLAAPPGSIPGATAHPAKAGEELVVLATGLGAVDSPIADGANSADKLRHTTTIPEVLIGGQAATVDFSGLSPQFVGVYQVNVTVPAVKAAGVVPLQINIGGITTSDKITIAVEN